MSLEILSSPKTWTNLFANSLSANALTTNTLTATTLSGANTITTGIIAHPSGGQSSAVPLTSAVNIVQTVATSGDSVALPQALQTGMHVTIYNTGASNLSIFPFLGDQINVVSSSNGILGINSSTFLYPGGSQLFTCSSVGNWDIILYDGPVVGSFFSMLLPPVVTPTNTSFNTIVGTGIGKLQLTPEQLRLGKNIQFGGGGLITINSSGTTTMAVEVFCNGTIIAASSAVNLGITTNNDFYYFVVNPVVKQFISGTQFLFGCGGKFDFYVGNAFYAGLAVVATFNPVTIAPVMAFDFQIQFAGTGSTGSTATNYELVGTMG